MFPLREMSNRRERARPDRPRPSDPKSAHDPPDRIDDRVHDAADRIALRRRTEVRGHDIGARRHSPDKHRLAEIAGLFRQSALRGDVEQAAEAEGGVEEDAADRNRGGVEAPLKDIVAEDARLFQVGVQILQPVPNRPGHRLDDRRRRVEHDLIQVKDAAIELLVGIVDRQRHVVRRSRTSANKPRQAQSAQPSDPAFNATHALTILSTLARGAKITRARPPHEPAWTVNPVLRKSDPPRVTLAEPLLTNYHPFATLPAFVRRTDNHLS